MCYNYEDMMRRGDKRAAHAEAGTPVGKAKSAEQEAEKAASEEMNTGLFPGKPGRFIPIYDRIPAHFIFGMLADWAKSPKEGPRSFNCKSETIFEKPMWRGPMNRGQRGLVMSSAFYETDRINKKRYRFSVKGKDTIYYAGIFNLWKDPVTKIVEKSFAIITCAPNDLVGSVHDRMPVILDAEGEYNWMKANASIDTLRSVFKPYPSHLMEMEEMLPLSKRKKKGPELGLDF